MFHFPVPRMMFMRRTNIMLNHNIYMHIIYIYFEIGLLNWEILYKGFCPFFVILEIGSPRWVTYLRGFPDVWQSVFRGGGKNWSKIAWAAWHNLSRNYRRPLKRRENRLRLAFGTVCRHYSIQRPKLHAFHFNNLNWATESSFTNLSSWTRESAIAKLQTVFE